MNKQLNNENVGTSVIT